jgi:hypothetical protein
MKSGLFKGVLPMFLCLLYSVTTRKPCRCQSGFANKQIRKTADSLRKMLSIAIDELSSRPFSHSDTLVARPQTSDLTRTSKRKLDMLQCVARSFKTYKRAYQMECSPENVYGCRALRARAPHCVVITPTGTGAFCLIFHPECQAP